MNRNHYLWIPINSTSIFGTPLYTFRCFQKSNLTMFEGRRKVTHNFCATLLYGSELFFWFGTFLQLKILKCQYNIDNLESERCDSKGKTKKRFLLYFSVQPFESPSFWLQDWRFKVFQLRECPKLAKIVRRNALSHVHMMKFNEWSSKTVTLNISLSESDLNFVCHDFTFWNIMAQKIYFENSMDFIRLSLEFSK